MHVSNFITFTTDYSIVTLISWKCKSVTTYNFCFNRVRDLISFLVDQILKSIHENVQTIENLSRITALVA